MKLKELYESIYNKIFSLALFRRILEKIPALGKLLQWETVSYLLFGALTTVVNLLVYWLVNLPMGKNYEQRVLFTVRGFDFRWIYAANAIAWLASVLFSFITNKLLVFESRGKDAKTVLFEMVSFFGSRILSFLLFEELLFGVCAHFMNDWLSKLLIAVFVVLFNYTASKFVIFRKKKNRQEGTQPTC